MFDVARFIDRLDETTFVENSETLSHIYFAERDQDFDLLIERLEAARISVVRIDPDQWEALIHKARKQVRK